MAKRKIGMSLILAFAVMLVFSVTAMAAVLAKPSVTVTPNNGEIKLSWTEVNDATGYEVYRVSVDTATENTLISASPLAATTKDFLVTGLDNTKRYGFKVVALAAVATDNSETTVYASPSAVPGKLTALSADKQVTLNWSAVTGAVGYKVYQNGNLIDTVTTTNKVVTGLDNGVKYKFEVASVTESVIDLETVSVDSKKIAVSIAAGGPAYNKDLNGSIAITDLANDKGPANANQTGTGIGTNDGSTNTQVIKSTGMVKNNGDTGTHRTHGEYQNNTNSCASCHQTHTGASKSLLFKDGVYNTCTACHDGTLGFYNVFEHSNAGTFGGTTDGNMSVHLADGSVQVKAAPGGNLSANSGAWVNEFNCASCHSPHGSYSDRLLHYNPNNMGIEPTSKGGIGIKGQDIIDFAKLTKVTKSIDGKDVVKQQIIWDLENQIKAGTITEKPKFIIVRGTSSEILKDTVTPTDVVITVYKLKPGSYGAADSFVSSATPWLYGYQYASPNKNYYTRFFKPFDKTVQAQIQAKDTSFKSVYIDNLTGQDTTNAKDANGDYNLPKLVDAYLDADGKRTADSTITGEIAYENQFEVAFHQASGTWHYKFVVDNHDQDWTDIQINWGKGYIRGVDANTNTMLNEVTTGDVARAYEVSLDLVEIAKFGDTKGVPILQSNVTPLYDGTKKDAGIAMSTYCASCHTDYLAHSGSETGTWDKAYRHSTDSDSYTCVRCHYAHGTDVTVMMDAEGHKLGDTLILDNDPNTEGNQSVIATEDYLLDQNPSSALKRYTNMSVCWGCHTDSKAEQLKNTNSYGDDDGQHDPHGLNPIESIPGETNPIGTNNIFAPTTTP